MKGSSLRGTLRLDMLIVDDSCRLLNTINLYRMSRVNSLYITIVPAHVVDCQLKVQCHH